MRKHRIRGPDNSNLALARSVVIGAIGILACLIILGVITDSFEAAAVWWSAVGPIAGYMTKDAIR